jgi:DNA-binding GntR family transcriptional regulator
MILKFGAFDNEILSDIYKSLLARVIIVVDMMEIRDMQTYGLPTTKKVVEALENRSHIDAKTAMTAHISPLLNLSSLTSGQKHRPQIVCSASSSGAFLRTIIQ